MNSTNSHLSISISLLSESDIQIMALSQIFSNKHEACAWKVKGRERERVYIVPAILVLIWVFSSSSSLAKPKSDILAFRYLSSSTLVALISL